MLTAISRRDCLQDGEATLGLYGVRNFTIDNKHTENKHSMKRMV